MIDEQQQKVQEIQVLNDEINKLKRRKRRKIHLLSGLFILMVVVGALPILMGVSAFSNAVSNLTALINTDNYILINITGNSNGINNQTLLINLSHNAIKWFYNQSDNIQLIYNYNQSYRFNQTIDLTNSYSKFWYNMSDGAGGISSSDGNRTYVRLDEINKTYALNITFDNYNANNYNHTIAITTIENTWNKKQTFQDGVNTYVIIEPVLSSQIAQIKLKSTAGSETKLRSLNDGGIELVNANSILNFLGTANPVILTIGNVVGSFNSIIKSTADLILEPAIGKNIAIRRNTNITNLTIEHNLRVIGNTTLQNLTITDLKICDIKTDINGNLYCGTDATGGGANESSTYLQLNSSTYSVLRQGYNHSSATTTNLENVYKVNWSRNYTTDTLKALPVCSGTDKYTSTSQGVITCATDQTGGGASSGFNFELLNVTVNPFVTTSNTVWSDVPNLTLLLSQNSRYVIDCRLIQSAGVATTGVQLNVSTSNTPLIAEHTYTSMSSASAMETFNGTNVNFNLFLDLGSSIATSTAFVSSYVQTNSNPSLYKIGIKSEISGSPVRVQRGSYCRAIKI